MCATSAPLWQPSPRRIAAANITRFMGGFRSYQELWEWSVSKPEEFWPSVARFCGVKTAGGASPRPLLNYAANLLRHHDHAPALISISAGGARREFSHSELARQAARAAQAMRAAGVGRGGCVAALLPSVPEAVIGFLAASSLGALWTALPPGAAPLAAAHFSRVQPSMLIVSSDALPAAVRLASALSSLRQTLVVSPAGSAPDLDSLPRALRWQDALALYSPHRIEFEPLPFNHPLAAYPEAQSRVDSCGETLLEHLKELILHVDVKPSDRLLSAAPCGSSAWTWALSSLAAGACVILLDGAESGADPLAWLRTVQLERATIASLQVSALDRLLAAGAKPRAEFALAALRTLCVPSPQLQQQHLKFALRELKRDLHFASMSANPERPRHDELGCPVLPVRSARPQAPALGLPPDFQRSPLF